jgi:hypothetical protein
MRSAMLGQKNQAIRTQARRRRAQKGARLSSGAALG